MGPPAAQTRARRRPPRRNSDTSDEIVVTAERRTENLQTAPLAATVISGDDLAGKGVTTVDPLQFVSPATTVDNFGQGNDFNIRGIGKGEHNTQTSTGVITYRDGVATFPGYFTLEPYYDIASVEILRGPQGTFGGQNCNRRRGVRQHQQPDHRRRRSRLCCGPNRQLQRLAARKGAVNLPISDTLAARIAFNTEQRDSFYKFTGPGGTPYNGNPGDLREYSARFSLLWKPNSDVVGALEDGWRLYGFRRLSRRSVQRHQRSLPSHRELAATSDRPRHSVDIENRISDVRTASRSGRSRGYQYAITQYRADLDGTATVNINFRRLRAGAAVVAGI